MLLYAMVLPAQAAQKPVADFSVSKTFGDAPLEVTFTDKSTGEEALWKWWGFGDETGSESTAKKVTHTYKKAGKYTVFLKATNEAGTSTKTYPVPITVTEQKPSAIITFSSGMDSSAVSPYTLNVMKQILIDAGLTSAKITSTIRTPQKQAEIMYANCERTGPEAQKGIYAPAGDKIIDV